MIEFSRLEQIHAHIDQFDPIRYAKTRNAIDGGVSYLSPYLSRGIITPKEVYQRLRKQGFSFNDLEAFVMELTWREHAQRLWQQYNPLNELRKNQVFLKSNGSLPIAVLEAATGIAALDQALHTLFTTGYMHNHARMYIAALVCNHYGCDWLTGSRWLFSHLKDADLASNSFSWQWICGANSTKIYVANQENINRFSNTQQIGTYLDLSYEQLQNLKLNGPLRAFEISFRPEKRFPKEIQSNLPTHLYTPYHLDPRWRSDEPNNSILFWDLKLWETNPFGEAIFNWINELAAQFIPSIQVVVCNWNELEAYLGDSPVFSKEHPSTKNLALLFDQRDWLLPNPKKIPIPFFPFWKAVKKQLLHEG
ncbi:MAG: hypothetical protein RLZZ301_492 [Bacteroidota bacterium]|jgi:deoxyribodipyrimidine photo-lyase